MRLSSESALTIIGTCIFVLASDINLFIFYMFLTCRSGCIGDWIIQ